MIRRHVAVAGAFLALTAGAVTPVLAKVPDPRFSRVSTVVVGTTSGTSLTTCTSGGYAPPGGNRVDGFYVEVREINNTPLWFETVTLDFSRTSLHLLADDTPGTTVDCAARTITRVTGSDGVAVFRPRFCGQSSGADVIVSVDGVWLRELPARSTDVDADGRTGLMDFARVARNLLDGSDDPATDFDPCSAGSAGKTTLSDFALFAGEMLRDARGTACP
jgi:hypothetical protein